MCFSATVSFSAAFVLLVIGIITLKSNKHKEYLFFSLIPLFFAIQQFSEGVLWISLQNPIYAQLQAAAMYVFLIFALGIWPVLVPFSLLRIERHAVRKKILSALLALGGLWFIYAAINLIIHRPTAAIINNHILYSLPLLAGLQALHGAVYMAVIMLPFFVTHIRPLWIFGGLALGTALMSYLVWNTFFISIWCFFAALVSIFVYHIIRTKRIRDIR